MINPKEIIKVGVILFVITAISALLLAFANKMTAPVIEENARLKTEQSMRTVLSEAEKFEMAQADGVVGIYIGKKGNEVVGVCAVTAANGYGGEVQVITGVNKNGEVTGIDILSHSETPGLGAEADKPEFKNQFTGKTADIGVARGNASGNEIDAMSGATITSKAVTEAVNAALSAADTLLKAQ